MVRRKKKKVRRQRGSRSYGWGVTKDHKGAGMRGGRGKAGTTTHRYIQVVKIEKATGKKVIGKYGFKRPQKMIQEVETMNVSHLDQSIDTLVEDGFAQKEGKNYTINLAEIGVDKLLAQGNVHRAIDVTVEKASERAVSKIEDAGGTVTLQS